MLARAHKLGKINPTFQKNIDVLIEYDKMNPPFAWEDENSIHQQYVEYITKFQLLHL